MFIANEVVCLAGDYDNQKFPKVVTVVQLRITASGGVTAKAVKGTEGHILFIGHPASRALQLLAYLTGVEARCTASDEVLLHKLHGANEKQREGDQGEVHGQGMRDCTDKSSRP